MKNTCLTKVNLTPNGKIFLEHINSNLKTYFDKQCCRFCQQSVIPFSSREDYRKEKINAHARKCIPLLDYIKNSYSWIFDDYISWLINTRRECLIEQKKLYIRHESVSLTIQQTENCEPQKQCSQQTIKYSRAGYIYLMRCKDTDRYKIGRTNNLKVRIKQLNPPQSPYQIEMVCSSYVPDSYLLEKTLHYLYMENRVRGEWFELNEKQVNDFRNIISKENI